MRRLTLLALALPALVAGCATIDPAAPAEPTVWPTEASLVGSWELAKVNRTATMPVVTVTFAADGVVHGAIHCNGWGGHYRLDGSVIEFSDDIIITTAGCRIIGRHELDEEQRADQSLFRHRAVFQSQDGQHLYFQGEDLLTFDRVP